MNKKNIAQETQKLLFDHNVKADVSININRKKNKLPPSIILMQTFATLSAINLKPVTCKVLFFLLGHSEFENYIGMDILTLSETLKISEASAKRAMKELTNNNIVSKLKNPRDRRRNDYFIHPVAAWKGSSINRDKAMNALMNNEIESIYGESIESSIERESIEMRSGIPLHQSFAARIGLKGINITEDDIIF